MSTKKHTEREVEKTLRALDGIEPAKTDAFFYSRLAAKMEHRKQVQQQTKTSFDYGFTFTMAAVFIILLMNLAFISFYQQSAGDEDASQQELFEELAYEYQVFDLNYYETFEGE